MGCGEEEGEGGGKDSGECNHDELNLKVKNKKARLYVRK